MVNLVGRCDMEIHRKNWCAWAEKRHPAGIGFTFVLDRTGMTLLILLYKFEMGFDYWRSK
jgi:hypothetical protein